ncbi:interleukin 17a/f3 [Centropristis striata]|uniref:interleukin 17a/f3 n=1 Tax=Centropristis striata TaxID=184440 RepID=UPI0027E02B22|nr:interleukin 17a/f3 [Centropristis striata]
MLLVLRALLVLATLLLATRTFPAQAVSPKLGQEAKPKERTVRLVLDPSVQTQIFTTSASTVASMSLTPWTYRDSCVLSRLPQRISHAQCLTNSCLSLQGGGEDVALVAKPIYYEVLVLHRVPRRDNKGGKKKKKNTKYDFRLGTEVITVGCTCVRPSVIPQQ